MNFSSKDNLIEFIKEQVNVCLSNEPGFLNEKENILYTEIHIAYKNAILRLLDKRSVQYNEHVKHWYWIYLDN